MEGGAHGFSGGHVQQGVDREVGLLLDAYLIFFDGHAVAAIGGLSYQNAVNIDVGILFGQGEDFHVAELGLQGDALYYLFAAQRNDSGIRLIHGGFYAVGMFTLGHGCGEESVFDRHLFIVHIYVGVGRLGAQYEELHVIFYNGLVFAVTGVQHHFVYGTFFDDVRIEVVSQDTQLVVQDRDTACATGDVQPDFSGFVFACRDAERVRFEHEILYVGYDTDQGTDFAVLVFLRGGYACRDVRFHAAERCDGYFALLRQCGGAADHCYHNRCQPAFQFV